MGVSNLVAASSGLTSAVKSVQTGSAGSAGTVTITSVNTSKCIVTSFPTGAAGTVSVSGGYNGENIGLNGTSGSQGMFTPFTNNIYYGLHTSNNGVNGVNVGSYGFSFPGNNAGNGFSQLSNTAHAPVYAAHITNFGVNAANGSTGGGNLNGGSTNLYAASYGAYLTNATTLTVTGPCQWQVVEYN